MQSFLNLIQGEWMESATGETFSTLNPADTTETVAQYPQAGQTDAKAAIEAAQQAFASWGITTPVARGRLFSKASQILESRKAARWNVPEPELALVANACGQIVGYTLGND